MPAGQSRRARWTTQARAVASLIERAAAAEARADQAQDFAKRAEQALALEQDRARQAEQERDAERSGAEGLSALLKATQLQLTNSVP
jgi:hypothetical protein